jgi:hypothetical protein
MTALIMHNKPTELVLLSLNVMLVMKNQMAWNHTIRYGKVLPIDIRGVISVRRVHAYACVRRPTHGCANCYITEKS